MSGSPCRTGIGSTHHHPVVFIWQTRWWETIDVKTNKNPRRALQSCSCCLDSVLQSEAPWCRYQSGAFVHFPAAVCYPPRIRYSNITETSSVARCITIIRKWQVKHTKSKTRRKGRSALHSGSRHITSFAWSIGPLALQLRRRRRVRAPFFCNHGNKNGDRSMIELSSSASRFSMILALHQQSDKWRIRQVWCPLRFFFFSFFSDANSSCSPCMWDMCQGDDISPGAPQLHLATNFTRTLDFRKN